MTQSTLHSMYRLADLEGANLAEHKNGSFLSFSVLVERMIHQFKLIEDIAIIEHCLKSIS